MHLLFKTLVTKIVMFMLDQGSATLSAFKATTLEILIIIIDSNILVLDI